MCNYTTKEIINASKCIVQFQKISIPTPWKVNGNSKGVGGGGSKKKSQNFKRNVWGLTGISRVVRRLKPKSLLWEGYGYFLEQHIVELYKHAGIFRNMRSTYRSTTHSRVLLTLHEDEVFSFYTQTHDVSRVPYNSIKHEHDIDHVLYRTL